MSRSPLQERDRPEVERLITDHLATVLGTTIPVEIRDVQPTDFFNWYNNTYDGWFITVRDSKTKQLFWLYFVVDLRGGTSDNDWFVEKIS